MAPRSLGSEVKRGPLIGIQRQPPQGEGPTALEREAAPDSPDQALEGKQLEAVVKGRANIVGKPMAQVLLDANATVTIAHSRTKDLASVVRRADIVVAAVGRPEMIGKDWLKDGATVIDVGINRLPPEPGADKGRLVGDVAFAEAAEVAGAITPVPGGVGPMTIAVLLRNTAVAAYRNAGLAVPEGL